MAKLERFIDKQGKTDAFRAAFKEVNGDEWVNARDSAAFFEDDVVEVLQSVLGMSETAARNWFNGEENADMSIKQLVSEIKEYVDSKEGNFRLLFCVDEVGQYIGDDGDLIMDTVDQRATEEWIANVKNVLKDKTPAYLVVSHMYIRQLQRNKSNKPAYEYHSHRKFHP